MLITQQPLIKNAIKKITHRAKVIQKCLAYLSEGTNIAENASCSSKRTLDTNAAVYEKTFTISPLLINVRLVRCLCISQHCL